jgi:hypothetical protein
MLSVVVAASGIFPASPSFHLFQINEFYSNASGSVQFIELLEGFGANGQRFLTGRRPCFYKEGFGIARSYPNAESS